MNALVRGVVAGVAGTGVMTGYQLAVAKLQGKPLATPVPHRWADAPAPAQVAKRIADAIGQGRRVTREDVPLLTNAMHWLYGVSWGAFYGVAAGATRPDPVAGGIAFGAGVWGAAYAELVPLGLYKPPWKYPPKELAVDLSYHLVYGLAVAVAYAALDRD
jgi:pimeloyl-ACP methyl ester carboxylesterase